MGTNRIHFTDADLARVTIAQSPAPLLETVLSLRLLQRRSAGPPAFEGWRSWSRTRFPREARPLLDLVGPTGPVPDFLTPPGAAGVHAADSADVLEGAIDTVLGTPRSRIRAELADLAEHRTPPPWTRSLADGERDALGAVGRAMRRYHQALITPFQQRLREETEQHASYAVRNMTSGGLDAALNGLHPGIRWRPPFLELPCCLPGGQDFPLQGRGLRLQPSFFGQPDPAILAGEPFVVTIPVTRLSGWGPPPQGASAAVPAAAPREPGEGLAALLGGTRAVVLRAVAVAGPQNTTALARRTGTALSTVSHHTAVLRDAGLLTTRRTGTSVTHAVTPLGEQLARQRPPFTPADGGSRRAVR